MSSTSSVSSTMDWPRYCSSGVNNSSQNLQSLNAINNPMYFKYSQLASSTSMSITDDTMYPCQASDLTLTTSFPDPNLNYNVKSLSSVNTKYIPSGTTKAEISNIYQSIPSISFATSPSLMASSSYSPPGSSMDAAQQAYESQSPNVDGTATPVVEEGTPDDTNPEISTVAGTTSEGFQYSPSPSPRNFTYPTKRKSRHQSHQSHQSHTPFPTSSSLNKERGRGRETMTPLTESMDQLLPVLDFRFNMREISKQSCLLEDHLTHKEKRCGDCCIKHFLTMEALAEEALTLDQYNEIRNHDEWYFMYELPIEIRQLQRMFIENPGDETVIHTIVQTLRMIRKKMMVSTFGIPFQTDSKRCQSSQCTIKI